MALFTLLVETFSDKLNCPIFVVKPSSEAPKPGIPLLSSTAPHFIVVNITNQSVNPGTFMDKTGQNDHLEDEY
ncbi:hypothetical protein [Endozoicomonas sp.]|uniref:hypothetical protein n=1 Tax=Endozoicomonas sp. TaxID=1892382 RepID=UPI002884D242|nr:hypothetical protein [Endozoicomonas sp.]